MIIKDAMVVIHLAKMTLLGTSCDYFQHVVIPEAVHREILEGQEKGYEDVRLVEELIKTRKLQVKRIRDEQLLKRAKAFNLQRGEAEAVALFWQEHADYVASDDDNLRRKAVVLHLKLIGTPAIVLKLCQEKLIDESKLRASLRELRKIGWFSAAVIDKLLMEAQ